jgi:peptidoglycan hydrolase CwlO-like protein
LLYSKDNQEREALYYQEQIDDLQNQVDQIQAELASKRERQVAEAEALSQTKEGIL